MRSTTRNSTIWALSFTRLEANRNLLTAMSLLPKSIHRCRCYPTKFNSGRDIPLVAAGWVNRQQQDVIDYLQEVYVAFVIDSPPFTARRQLRPRRHLACRDTQDGRGALARSRGAVLQRK